MNTRNLVWLGVNIFSISSALNSAFVRSEKIDELFKSDQNETNINMELFNIVFGMLNLLAVTPEILYNVGRNARLPHVWRDIQSAATNNISPTAIKIVTAAILLAAIPTVLAEGVVYFDANENIFITNYKIKLSEENLTSWAFIFASTFSALGCVQHWLHGSLSLAAGASQPNPAKLFYNSGSIAGNTKSAWAKRLYQNFVYDGGINALLLSAVLAEFVLSYNEFSNQVVYNKERLAFANNDFLLLANFTLSTMGAFMYLSHEGRAFLNIKKTLLAIRTRSEEEDTIEKQLYFLASAANALVHGLSRYQAFLHLSEKNSPSPFFLENKLLIPLAIMASIISGLSRVNMLIEEKYESKENDLIAEPGSRKYDAYQRGKEVMYESFFLISALLGLAWHLDQKNAKVPRSHLISLGVAPAALSELTLFFVGFCCNQSHSFDVGYFLIDALATPALCAYFFSHVNHTNSTDYWNYNALMRDAGPTLIFSLFLRHWIKKLLSYPEVAGAIGSVVSIINSRTQALFSCIKELAERNVPPAAIPNQVDEETSLLHAGNTGNREKASCPQLAYRAASSCFASVTSCCATLFSKYRRFNQTWGSLQQREGYQNNPHRSHSQ